MYLVCGIITTYDDVQFGLELLKHFTFLIYSVHYFMYMFN